MPGTRSTGFKFMSTVSFSSLSPEKCHGHQSSKFTIMSLTDLNFMTTSRGTEPLGFCPPKGCHPLPLPLSSVLGIGKMKAKPRVPKPNLPVQISAHHRFNKAVQDSVPNERVKQTSHSTRRQTNGRFPFSCLNQTTASSGRRRRQKQNKLVEASKLSKAESAGTSNDADGGARQGATVVRVFFLVLVMVLAPGSRFHVLFP